MNTLGWVIHKQWSGETSAYVFFFTREHGLIRALCKGGRLPKKQILLQAFTPLWVEFNEKSNNFYVKHLELSSQALALEGINLLAGLYVNELVYYALRVMDAYPVVFDAYEHLLRYFIHPLEPANLAQYLRDFERLLLMEMGYNLSLVYEGISGEAIVSHKHYQLQVDEGFIESSQGLMGEHLLAWANNEWHRSEVRQTAKTVMRIMIDHALGGQAFYTRELLTKSIQLTSRS